MVLAVALAILGILIAILVFVILVWLNSRKNTKVLKALDGDSQWIMRQLQGNEPDGWLARSFASLLEHIGKTAYVHDGFLLARLMRMGLLHGQLGIGGTTESPQNEEHPGANAFQPEQSQPFTDRLGDAPPNGGARGQLAARMLTGPRGIVRQPEDAREPATEPVTDSADNGGYPQAPFTVGTDGQTTGGPATGPVDPDLPILAETTQAWFRNSGEQARVAVGAGTNAGHPH